MDDFAQVFKTGGLKLPASPEEELFKLFKTGGISVPPPVPMPSIEPLQAPHQKTGLHFDAPEPPPTPAGIQSSTPRGLTPYEKYDLGFKNMPRVEQPAQPSPPPEDPLSPELQGKIQDTPKAEDPIQLVRARARLAHDDPSYRQKLLGEINAGPKPSPREWVNPITQPGKWATRLGHNLGDPLREAWEDHSWFGPVHKLMAGVALPFNLISAPITTTLGYDKAPSFLDAAIQDINEGYHANSDLGAAATFMGGLALDFLNPLNFVTMGAKPLAEAGRNILRRVPSSAGISDLEKLGEIGVQRYRQGAVLTPQNIREVVAPNMALENARGAFSSLTQKEAAAVGAPVQAINASNEQYAHVLAAMEGPYKNNRAIPGLGKTYTELVEDARKLPDLYDYKYIPEAVVKPGNGIAEIAPYLAKHQAYLEKAVWDDRPLLRVMGRTIGWGDWRVPSPVETLKNLSSGVFGKWNEYALPKTPIVESLRPIADSLGEYLQKPLGISDEAWGRFTGKDLENAVQSFQTGIRQFEKGVRGPTGFKQVPGLLYTGPSLDNWVYAEIRNMANPANQQRHIDNMLNAYRGIQTMIEKEPDALWTRNAQQIGQAVEHLEGIQQEGASAFVQRIQDAGQFNKPIESALFDPRGPQGGKIEKFDLRVPSARTNEEILKNFQDNMKRLETLVTDIKDVAQPMKAPAARTAGEYADAMANAISASKSDFAHAPQNAPEVWHLMEQIRGDWDLLMNSSRPYAYDVMDVYGKRNVAHQIDAMRNDVNSVKLWVDKYFVNSERSVSGVESLGKMLQTEGGRNFWQKWAAPESGPFAGAWDLRSTLYTTDPITGARTAAYALDDAQRAAVQAALGKKLTALETAGKMTSAEANEVMSFMGQLNNEQVGKMLYTMSNTAKSKLTATMRARVVHQLAAPFEAALEKAESMIRTTYASDLRKIYNAYADVQAHYTPRDFWTKVWNAPNGPIAMIDKLWAKVSKGLGFSPVADTVLRNLESERAHNTVRSETFGTQWSKDNIVKNAAAVDPARFGNGLPHGLEFELNDAHGQIVSNMLSTNYANEAAEKVIGKGWQQFVRGHAAQEVAEGWTRLTNAFGGDKTKAKAFFDSVDHNSFLDNLFSEESRLGMQELPRESYMKYKLLGNANDITELQRGIDAVLDDIYGVSDIKATLAPRTFGPGMQRRFYDVAEIMAKAKWDNAARKAKGLLPYDVSPVYHTSALLAERYKDHLAGVLNRRALDDLQAVLPDYVRVFTKTPKHEGWKDMGDLISSYRGKGWYVHDKLYEYLKRYVPQYERESHLSDAFVKFNQWLTRLSTNFSLIHLKNQIALAFIGEVDPNRTVKWLKYMWENRDKVGEYMKYHPLTPIERMKHAIDGHDLYNEMVANGVTHFRGDADFKSVAENVMDAMRPRSSGIQGVKEAASRWTGIQGIGKSLGNPQGPFTTMVFDVFDRALKMAKYEELRAAGIPGQQAADMVNHFLIDYSCRMLNPEVKRWGYTVMPFFAWNVGNGMLHIPNMIKNPRMYSLIRTAENFVNSQYSPYANLPQDRKPEAIAYAMATPWSDSNGYTRWLFPELPQDAWERLLRNLGKNPTNINHLRAQLWRFVLSRNRIAEQLYDAMNITKWKKLQDESTMDNIVGDVDKPGQMEDLFWGFGPYWQSLNIGIRSMTDPGAWKDLPWVVPNMFMKVESVDPRGRPAYEGEWKRIAARKLGLSE